jgi:RNA polymerase sigma factor (sigma-70 family)
MGTVHLLRVREPEPPPRDEVGDAYWVVLAQGGDRRAQEVLFRRHVVRIARLAHRILSSSPDDVDDLVQDVFIQAFSSLGGLRTPEAFGGWLGAILVRTASKRLRRQKLMRALGLLRREPIQMDELPRSAALSADRALELKALYAHLQAFPVEERIVLTLRRVEGMDAAEIAAHLGKSVSTVKRRLRRAEARMTLLSKKGFGT